MSDATPVRLLGGLFLALGGAGFALMAVGAGAATNVVSIDVLTTGPIRRMIETLGTLITIISPVFLVVGIGLVRQASWARPMAFAVAMMSVFSFPIGTLLALVTFAVLSQSGAKGLFGAADWNAAPVQPERPPDPDRAVPRPEPAEAAPAAAVSLTYDVGVDDLVAFAEYHAAHSPAVRRNYYWSLGSGALLVVVLLWMLGFRTLGGWAGAIVALVGWVVYFNWRTQTGNRRYYRRVYSEGANRGMLGLHRLSADAEGLTVSTDVTDMRTRWSGIERIEETLGLAFIYVGSLNAYTVPEARVVEGHYRECIAAIRRLHADASVPP